MDFQGLNNEQLIFIYLENKTQLDYFEDIIENEGIVTEIELPLFGSSVHIHKITEELLTNIDTSELVKYLRNINDVLEPIVNLIKEVDLPMYEKVEKINKTKFNL